MPLFNSNNNNNYNNTNDPNADNSFIRTILNYENESLTSPSSLFDFATTNDVDRILTNDDIKIIVIIMIIMIMTIIIVAYLYHLYFPRTS